MRALTLLALAAVAVAQPVPQMQSSGTTESLRGISAVTRNIAWASGAHGTYLRTTDGGNDWISAQVPDAAALDFRAVVAFSADEAFLMSAGPGDQSRIYRTSDAGRHWQLQFTNHNLKGFFDSMVFWDRTHGVVLGDPVPDASGKLKFEMLETDDGQSWHSIASSRLPEAIEGEGAFAASNSCIAILNAGSRQDAANLWFATGGKVARVFRSSDRGQTWEVFDTPIMHGTDSAGIFSIAFHDPLHGVIVGGDYKHPQDHGANLALTDDGGKTWHLQQTADLSGFISAVAENPRKEHEGVFVGSDFLAISRQDGRMKYPNLKFNAASSYDGGAFVVGPKGAIAKISY